MALHEKTTTDLASGHIVGDSFADYLIPVHADMPEFDIAMIEEEDPHLPGGVKGIGMLGTGGIQAAIANAVYHATGNEFAPCRYESKTLSNKRYRRPSSGQAADYHGF